MCNGRVLFISVSPHVALRPYWKLFALPAVVSVIVARCLQRKSVIEVPFAYTREVYCIVTIVLDCCVFGGVKLVFEFRFLVTL